MAHESRDRIRQRELIRCQPRWIRISKSRRRIVLRVKTISSDAVQEVYSLPRAWKRSGGIHPEWGKVAPTIKRLDGGSVLRARHVLLESARD
jgi:hypothetical protein